MSYQNTLKNAPWYLQMKHIKKNNILGHTKYENRFESPFEVSFLSSMMLNLVSSTIMLFANELKFLLFISPCEVSLF